MNCYAKANEKNSMTFAGDKNCVFLDVYDVLEDSSMIWYCSVLSTSHAHNET